MSGKLLFVNQKQFGFHISYFQYCKFLKNDFNITYLCWDYSRKKIAEEGIEVIYISRSGNIISRNIRFIKSVIKQIRNQNYYIVFINYFRGCSIIPLIFNRMQRIHLHIVTGGVSFNSLNRNIYNMVLRYETYLFRSVSIISKGLRDYFKLNSNIFILPLGATPMYLNRKPLHKICLLYVGTFTNRHLEDTVEGLGLFIRQNPDADIHYTIIGSGWGSEANQIRKKITEFDLMNFVELRGYITYFELIPYYEKANVGVAYVPITSFFEYQPVTKTFEYLMTGMPVIATDTYENRQIINNQNGILIKDNPEDFAQSINQLYFGNKSYDEQTIRDSVADYEWEKIVDNMRNTILQ